MKRPAFQFYPADWRGSRWVTFDYEGCMILPRLPACYVIYLDGELSYIGQASDLATRMSSHGIRACHSGIATKWGYFRRVVIKARFGTRMGDWAMREIRLIHRLQPHLNCVGSSKMRGSK